MDIAKYNLFPIFLILIIEVNCGSVVYYDMPLCRDLESYLSGIEKAIRFVETITIDINIGFGLVVLRANLKHISRTLNLTNDIIQRIYKISTEVEKLVNSKDFPMSDPWREDFGMTKLFNLTYIPNLSQYPIVQPALKFNHIYEYLDEFKTSKLTIHLSDSCIGEFQEMGKFNGSVKCPVTKQCLFFVVHGSDYAYGLTHRLAFIVLANSRGCYVLSPEDDKKLLHRFCSAIYAETLYIVYYSYFSLDLVMESICLCASLGYIQFLSRIWYEKILSYQSDYGCFEVDQLPSISRRLQDVLYMRLNRTYTDFLKNSHCDIHLTAMTIGALAVGTRYTMQKCYNVLPNATDMSFYDFDSNCL